MNGAGKSTRILRQAQDEELANTAAMARRSAGQLGDDMRTRCRWILRCFLKEIELVQLGGPHSGGP